LRLAARQVFGDRVGRFVERREALVLRHELDDPAHAVILETMTDVDERDAGDARRRPRCDRQ
jgi:hypothetical protein